MLPLNFYIADVFAEKKYTGNQLAVFRSSPELDDKQMQIIAKEMNYSETTFIMDEQPVDGKYPVRIFTPEEEVPFAGHPTLGTAYILQKEILKKNVQKIVLKLKVGEIPVTFRYRGDLVDTMWMVQKQPHFEPPLTVDALYSMLGLAREDFDDRFPVQVVSTGLPFIIVPLKNLSAVKNARIDKGIFFNYIKNRSAKAILVFCPETYDRKNHLNVRVFVDYYGIPEDPATGSANGCLTGYLVKHRYFGKEEIDIQVEQGYEIGRHSLLYLRGKKTEAGIHVEVGGKAIVIARGQFI